MTTTKPVILVTGATDGIGLGTARELARSGATVLIHGRNPERLAAIAKDTPKPLLNVAGKPLIDYTVDKLKSIAGISETVVVTNNKFYDHFCRWAKAHGNMKIRIVNDGTNVNEERLGSVGDIRFVWEKEAGPDDWLVVGGDNIFDQDFNEFLSFAKNKTPAVTIGLYDIRNIAEAAKFGVCALDRNNKATAFVEKSPNPPSSLVSMCLYYFPKATLGYMEAYHKESKALDAAGSYIKWLVEKKNVYGFQFTGKWYDIGSVESLQEAQERFKQS